MEITAGAGLVLEAVPLCYVDAPVGRWPGRMVHHLGSRTSHSVGRGGLQLGEVDSGISYIARLDFTNSTTSDCSRVPKDELEQNVNRREKTLYGRGATMATERASICPLAFEATDFSIRDSFEPYFPACRPDLIVTQIWRKIGRDERDARAANFCRSHRRRHLMKRDLTDLHKNLLGKEPEETRAETLNDKEIEEIVS